MLRRLRVLLALILCFPALLRAADLPSFDKLYPSLSAEEKQAVFSPEALVYTAKKKVEPRYLSPAFKDLPLLDPVLKQKPLFLIESLRVIPHAGKVAAEDPDVLLHNDSLAIYNALNRISDLQGRLYHSFTRDKDVPLFEEASRVDGTKKVKALKDREKSRVLPPDETSYIRLKDINFGNTYYQGDIVTLEGGLLYGLTNFRTISYLFFPVIKEGGFNARFYLAPIQEGILIYCLGGAEVSSFVASQVDMPSAIRKRLVLILDWVVDGISLF